MGKWMSEAVDSFKKNGEIARQVFVDFFLVRMTLSQPTEKNRAEDSGGKILEG